MTKAEAYAIDAESLRYKSMPELCEVIELLIQIIKDQDETINLQSSIIDALEDDCK